MSVLIVCFLYVECYEYELQTRSFKRQDSLELVPILWERATHTHTFVRNPKPCHCTDEHSQDTILWATQSPAPQWLCPPYWLYPLVQGKVTSISCLHFVSETGHTQIPEFYPLTYDRNILIPVLLPQTSRSHAHYVALGQGWWQPLHLQCSSNISR